MKLTNQEITFIITILSQLQWRTGQSKDLQIAESIIKNGQEYLKYQQGMDKGGK